MQKKFPLKHLLLLCFLCLGARAFAQQVKVEGTVTSADSKEALPGVTIHVKGDKSGTTTDASGHYTVDAAPNAVLVFTFIGYNSREEKVNGRTRIDAHLVPSSNALKETVVIGYQEISKRLTTAAVSSVTAKDIRDLPAASFDQMIQGRVSGVNIQQITGEPGVKGTFVVRGNTAISQQDDNGYDPNALSNPLYVIDGVPLSNDELSQMYTAGTGTNFLATLNPNDIESIDVLKDASAAAIYGSRGANGVVIVKTKRGQLGAPKISFNMYEGFIEQPRLRQVLAGATERRAKVGLLEHFGNYQQLQYMPMMLTDSLNPAFNNATDWQSLFYKSGFIQNYNVSIAGGTENARYRISLGHYNEDGVIKNTGFKRYSISANLNFNIGKHVEDATTIFMARTDRPRGRGQVPGKGAIPLDVFPSSFYDLTTADKQYWTGDYSLSRDKNITNTINLNNILGYKIFDWLKLNNMVSASYTVDRRDVFRPAQIDPTGTSSASSNVNIGEDYSLDDYLQINKSFGKHFFNFITGQRINYHQDQSTYASGTSIPNDNIQVVQGIQQQNIFGSSDITNYGIVSYYARVNYNFKERYILQMNWDADGSSKFGQDNQWGYFPSVSAGWIISDESFMAGSSNWLSLLKLRASYGINGDQITNRPYLRYSIFSVNQGQYGGGSANNTTTYNGITAITPDYTQGLPQNRLTWEQTRQTDLGVDLELWKGRIFTQLDYYDKTTSGIPFFKQLPPTNGYDKVYTNGISVNNRGIEAMIDSRNIRNKNFQWETILNGSYNLNRIVSLPYNNRDLFTDQGRLLTRGKPGYQFWLEQVLGVYDYDSQVPVNPFTGQVYNFIGYPYHAGSPIIRDIYHSFHVPGGTGQGVVDGDPNPKWTGGLTNMVTYKNFTLNIFCIYTFGRKVINTEGYNRWFFTPDGGAFNDGKGDNLAKWYIPDLSKQGFWYSPGHNAKYPAINPYEAGYPLNPDQDIFLENGDYVKVKNVSLSYNFTPNVLKALKISRMRVYVMTENVAEWQASKDLPDAEQVDAYGNYNGDGYPIPRKYTLGLDLDF